MILSDRNYKNFFWSFPSHLNFDIFSAHNHESYSNNHSHFLINHNHPLTKSVSCGILYCIYNICNQVVFQIGALYMYSESDFFNFSLLCFKHVPHFKFAKIDVNLPVLEFHFFLSLNIVILCA